MGCWVFSCAFWRRVCTALVGPEGILHPAPPSHLDIYQPCRSFICGRLSVLATSVHLANDWRNDMPFPSDHRSSLELEKLQMHNRVQWIGWGFEYTAGIVLLEESKRLKILGMVQDLQKHPRLTEKDLERFLGLALWASHLFPSMKSLVPCFCHDLFSPAATNCSISPDVWPQIKHHLTDTLQFKSVPPGTAIPLHSTLLLSVRHQQLHSLADPANVRITDRRVWVRISSQFSSKRRLSQESVRICGLIEHWLLHVSPFVSMRPASVSDLLAQADASAQGQSACVGGFVSHPTLGQRWFREEFSYQECRTLGVAVRDQMQLEVSSYEALAQAGLIVAASQLLPCSRITIKPRTHSDNSGAEAGMNTNFTTAEPLCYFLEGIALLAAVHRTIPDVTHISGERNSKADALSSPAEFDVPYDCMSHERVRLRLSDLWLPRPSISISPSGATLPWTVRAQGVPNNLT